MMSLLSLLTDIDRTVFLWINRGLSNPVLDVIAPWFRERWIWAPLYLFVVSFLGLNYGKKGWLLALLLVVSAGLTDFTSSTLIKKNVQRLRPCRAPELQEVVVMRVPCGGGYSFTSSHAANHFAVAVFLIGVLGPLRRWIKPALLCWAGGIAFSQVYVGVHYPGDVAVGALIGAAIGRMVFLFAERRHFLLKKV